MEETNKNTAETIPGVTEKTSKVPAPVPEAACENRRRTPSVFGLIKANKLFSLIIAILLIAVLVLGISVTKTKTSSKTVELGLRNIGELATQSAFFTNVQTISASRAIGSFSIPFTSSNYVYSYDGVIKAGYDFEDIALSVDAETKTVSVSLPPVKILSCEVDESSLKIYHENSNIYTPLTLESISESIEKLKEEAARRSIENGLFEAARSNAETMITLFLSGAYHTEEYKFEFIDAEVG